MPRFLRFDLMRRLGMLAVSLIVACVVLVGCASGGDEPESTTVPEATDTPIVVPTALTGTPQLGEPVWTSAIEPGTNAPTAGAPQVSDAFIYAVFPIESLPAGSQLVASWFFNDTSLDALDSAMRIDRDRTSGWIEFHIERTGSDPWPNGAYEIVLTDGTTELQRAVVTIS